MRRVDQLPNERVTALDTQLRQRFAAEHSDRSARLSLRRKPLRGQARNGTTTADTEVNTQALGTVLGGLEVVTSTGFQVLVTAGSMFCAHTAQTLTRPGTFSGNLDPDDDPVGGVYALARNTTVAPASAPASIAAAEWWAVVATPAVVAVESDSARKVFNKTTGAFDNASVQKIFHRQLNLSVVRGAGGGAISTVTIPAGGVVIAWLYVHAIGETNLDNALYYDARRMPDPVAPNRVGGHWVAKGQTLNGEWRATLLGEELSLRAASNVPADTTLPFSQIAEPGATWPASGVAYLYLARVRGTVPRLVGTLELEDTLYDFTSFEVAGALVLSPTPPATLPPAQVTGSGAGREQFDLRNASTLTLPNPTHTPGVAPGVLALKFGGTAPAGEAICVGMFPYTSLSSLLPVTDASDEIVCGADGWTAGDAVRSTVTSQIAGLSTAANTGTGLPVFTWTVVASTSGTKLPVDGIGWNLQLDAGNVDTVRADVEQDYLDDTNLEPPNVMRLGCFAYELGAHDGRCFYPTTVRMLPSASTVRARWRVSAGGGVPLSYTVNVENARFRFPYNEPLYTPRLERERGVGCHAGLKALGARREARHDVEDDLEHVGGVLRRAHRDLGREHVGVGAHLRRERAGLPPHRRRAHLPLRLDRAAEARQVREAPEVRLRHRRKAGLERRQAVEKGQAPVGRGDDRQGHVGPERARRGARERRPGEAHEGRCLGRHGRVRRKPQRRRHAEHVRAAGRELRRDEEHERARPVGQPRRLRRLDAHEPRRARPRERPDARVLGVVRVDPVDRPHVGRQGHVDRFLTA